MKSFFGGYCWAWLLSCTLFFGFLRSSLAAGEGVELTGGLALWQSPDFVGVRAMGMGNAGIALVEGMDAMFLNPAAVARKLPNYLIEAAFSFHPAADSRVFHVGMTDSKSNAFFAGGLSYSYFAAPREDDGKRRSIEGHLPRFALAIGLQEQLFLGVSLKYAYFSRPFLQDLSALTIDAGVLWQIHPLFAVSVTGYNLIYHDSGELPISMAVGAAFGHDLPFRLALDWVIDFQTKKEVAHELRIGLEIHFLNKMFHVRAGYQIDQVHDRRPVAPWLPATNPDLSHFLGVGLSFRYAWLGLAAAFRQQLALDALGANRYLSFALQLWL